MYFRKSRAGDRRGSYWRLAVSGEVTYNLVGRRGYRHRDGAEENDPGSQGVRLGNLVPGLMNGGAWGIAMTVIPVCIVLTSLMVLPVMVVPLGDMLFLVSVIPLGGVMTAASPSVSHGRASEE